MRIAIRSSAMGASQMDTIMLTADTITDDQIREAYRERLISFDLLEFATFPAWKATQRDYRERCAKILNAHWSNGHWSKP